MAKVPKHKRGSHGGDICTRLLQRLQQVINDFDHPDWTALSADCSHDKGLQELTLDTTELKSVELRDISGEELCLLTACISRDADWLHQCLQGGRLTLADLVIAMEQQQTLGTTLAPVSVLHHLRAGSMAAAGSYRCVRCRRPQMLAVADRLSICGDCSGRFFYYVSEAVPPAP
ncbi:hypothetical protein MIB92_13740 [Aestuariirhabdus sp. Z084]|uniref:hypothetical protein n=1 Tax=Aestuariirhabdus haliotis TaxID=2918751 RepID=UPI00201B3E33|nr:hypothetical protein [Aestuariirhabdus haliotis]MCL6416717.1 hypothetical protein [Aestuariirhabdus haliotis]MCL6420694.1 hypothetical protein [Aestuariirhabdus haliotis]